MKTLHFLLLLIPLAGCKKENPVPVHQGPPVPYIVTANEGAGSLSVFNASTMDSVTTVSFHAGGNMMMPHNVQAAPDGEYVYVTIMPPATSQSALEEQLVEVHIPSGKITRRLHLGFMQHLAHVICSSNGNLYVTSTMKGDVIEVNRKNFTVSRRIPVGQGRGPHGIREAGGKLWVANISGRSLTSISLPEGTTKEYFLGGMSYQVAADASGSVIYVTQFDKGQVARLNTVTEEIDFLDLPNSSGPVQLSLSSNQKHLVICDQGLDYGQPVSNLVFIVDAVNFQISGTVVAHSGPHGVAIDPFSAHAYVTCKLEGTVNKIDLSSLNIDTEKICGSMPNGITWVNNRKGI